MMYGRIEHVNWVGRTSGFMDCNVGCYPTIMAIDTNNDAINSQSTPDPRT